MLNHATMRKVPFAMGQRIPLPALRTEVPLSELRLYLEPFVVGGVPFAFRGQLVPH
jgi:hypothetical protein